MGIKGIVVRLVPIEQLIVIVVPSILLLLFCQAVIDLALELLHIIVVVRLREFISMLSLIISHYIITFIK